MARSRSWCSDRQSKDLALFAKAMSKLSPKIGRNDPCVCGSGKKYKKCCLDKECLLDGDELKLEKYRDIGSQFLSEVLAQFTEEPFANLQHFQIKLSLGRFTSFRENKQKEKPSSLALSKNFQNKRPATLVGLMR